jgi:hypothetical protein
VVLGSPKLTKSVYVLVSAHLIQKVCMGTLLGEIVDFVLVIIRLAIWLEFIFLDFFCRNQ